MSGGGGYGSFGGFHKPNAVRAKLQDPLRTGALFSAPMGVLKSPLPLAARGRAAGGSPGSSLVGGSAGSPIAPRATRPGAPSSSPRKSPLQGVKSVEYRNVDRKFDAMLHKSPMPGFLKNKTPPTSNTNTRPNIASPPTSNSGAAQRRLAVGTPPASTRRGRDDEEDGGEDEDEDEGQEEEEEEEEEVDVGRRDGRSKGGGRTKQVARQKWGTEGRSKEKEKQQVAQRGRGKRREGGDADDDDDDDDDDGQRGRVGGSKRKRGEGVSDDGGSKDRGKATAKSGKSSSTGVAAAPSSTTLSENGKTLSRWIVRFKRNSKGKLGVIVEGFLDSDKDSDNKSLQWKSSFIETRETEKRLKTGSGSLYILSGMMDSRIETDSSIPGTAAALALIQKFRRGFPEDWERLLEQADEIWSSRSPLNEEEGAGMSASGGPASKNLALGSGEGAGGRGRGRGRGGGRGRGRGRGRGGGRGASTEGGGRESRSRASEPDSTSGPASSKTVAAATTPSSSRKKVVARRVAATPPPPASGKKAVVARRVPVAGKKRGLGYGEEEGGERGGGRGRGRGGKRHKVGGGRGGKSSVSSTPRVAGSGRRDDDDDVEGEGVRDAQELGTSRSGRKVSKPLEFWRHEVPVYQRDGEGTRVLVKVVSGSKHLVTQGEASDADGRKEKAGSREGSQRGGSSAPPPVMMLSPGGGTDGGADGAEGGGGRRAKGRAARGSGGDDEGDQATKDAEEILSQAIGSNGREGRTRGGA